jgi:hypothetical protein
MNAVPSQIHDIGTVDNCVVEFGEECRQFCAASRICSCAGRRPQECGEWGERRLETIGRRVGCCSPGVGAALVLTCRRFTALADTLDDLEREHPVRR